MRPQITSKINIGFKTTSSPGWHNTCLEIILWFPCVVPNNESVELLDRAFPRTEWHWQKWFTPTQISSKDVLTWNDKKWEGSVLMLGYCDNGARRREKVKTGLARHQNILSVSLQETHIKKINLTDGLFCFSVATIARGGDTEKVRTHAVTSLLGNGLPHAHTLFVTKFYPKSNDNKHYTQPDLTCFTTTT